MHECWPYPERGYVTPEGLVIPCGYCNKVLVVAYTSSDFVKEE